MKIHKKFPEKRILITGAGCGLGRALALEFAALGWNIAVTDIDKKRIQETVELIRETGGNAIDFTLDVTKPEEFTRAVKTVKKEWKGLDILVNNAGVAAAGYFEKIPLSQWEWIMAINLKSIIYGCRAFIPLFKKQNMGYIVNVASNAGIASLPEMSCYNMTKSAVISMSETLNVELSGSNIGVSVVCPTFFKTYLMDQFKSPDEKQRQLAERFFATTFVTSEKIARHIRKSVEKNRLYVITQRDGKNMWRLKRFFPELYFKVLSLVYKTGAFEKHLEFFLKILNKI